MHASINLREQDALFVTLFCLMFRLTTNEIGLILKFHFHRQYNKQLPGAARKCVVRDLLGRLPELLGLLAAFLTHRVMA